jgi:hypothetical protein
VRWFKHLARLLYVVVPLSSCSALGRRHLAADLAIADRGGICISRQVLDQIEDKLELSFRELGRQNLKNISKPIEVYAVELHERGTEHHPSLPTQALSKRSGIAARPTGCA